MNSTEAPAHSGHLSGYWKRRTAALFRWLHIYLSMVSFGLLFFFAVTGLTLNHADWFFSNRDATRRETGTLAREWVSVPDDIRIAKLEIVEHLRSQHHIRAAVGEFRLDPTECTVVFKGPGYSAEARIDRGTGSYEFQETRFGFVAVMNDLHKARDTGAGWSFVVDLSAGLMVAVSLTGMVLIYFVKRKFVSGVITALAGIGLALGAYFYFVP
jgi:hypothetical protein